MGNRCLAVSRFVDTTFAPTVRIPDTRRATLSVRESFMRALTVTAQCAILVPLLAGCPMPPPASPMPTAAAALDRMKASAACGSGVQATAKIDFFGPQGRVRADLSMLASSPARLRMDVFSSFNTQLATLTSDGARFALADLREKRFLYGPASACNIARLTQVPIPGHALVSLLRGQAPLLKHEGAAGTIAWSGSGYYVITLPSTRDATQEIQMTPHPADLGKPWAEQRMRVLRVTVRQYGDVLYDAKLDGHRQAAMAKERVDPDGIDPPLQPSGPVCEAELPRKIEVDVPMQDEEVVFTYDTVTWNPPLIEGVFLQQPPAGLPIIPVRCD